MTGLRERKRRRTATAIHEAAMRLFAERGYAAVTITEIAEAADVGRATVFAHYPAKEDIVLGEAPDAVAALRAALADADPATPVAAVVRAWVRMLGGWLEDEAVLQLRIAEEVPAVAAARSRLLREIEDVIAGALGSDGTLAPRLAAAALTSTLAAIEAEALRRLADGGAPLGEEEIDARFADAAAFVEAGVERLRTRPARS